MELSCSQLYVYKPGKSTGTTLTETGIFPIAFATPIARDRNELRINQFQVIGSHNSYHIEPTLAERPLIEGVVGLSTAQDLYYSHATISDQLTYQSIRGFEFDLFADSRGGMYATPLARNLSKLPFPDVPALKLPGTKVLHIADVDVNSQCKHISIFNYLLLGGKFSTSD